MGQPVDHGAKRAGDARTAQRSFRAAVRYGRVGAQHRSAAVASPQRRTGRVPHEDALGFVPHEDALGFVPHEDALGFVPHEDALGFVPHEDALGFVPHEDALGFVPHEDALGFVPPALAAALPRRRIAAAVIAVTVGLGGVGAAEARPLVVLDAGHGGSESGTRSAGGTLEKHVVLSITHLTANELRDRGYRVVMTREEDKNLSHGARTAMANSRSAAVFVSIHANWAPVPSRRGIECYILSADASDKRTAALLRREEGTDRAAGRPGASDLSAILSDLAQTRAHAEAAHLARRMQDALGKVEGLKPARGLRQAPFAVLKGARMPAVLIELGYLSNPDQAKFLSRPSGQREVADSLARGIASFLRRRR